METGLLSQGSSELVSARVVLTFIFILQRIGQLKLRDPPARQAPMFYLGRWCLVSTRFFPTTSSENPWRVEPLNN